MATRYPQNKRLRCQQKNVCVSLKSRTFADLNKWF